MPESEMWIEGNEDGEVSVVCMRPECMQGGPVTPWNPAGLYQAPIAVEPYRPNPIDIARAWAEHRATHNP